MSEIDADMTIEDDEKPPPTMRSWFSCFNFSALLGRGCFEVDSWSHDAILLFLICFVTFGSWFCYDNPAALEENLIDTMQISYTQYGLYYSMYAFVSVVVTLPGGFLTDAVFGLRSAAILYASICLVGQLIFATATWFGSFGGQLFGRFVFALGGENLAVCKKAYATRHFLSSGRLNLAFGLMILGARIASFINQLGMPAIFNAIYNKHGSDIVSERKSVAFALFVACFTCVIGLIFAIFLMLMDRRIEKHRKTRSDDLSQSREKRSFLNELKQFKNVREFSILFWMLCTCCVFIYCTVFPAISFGQTLYINKWSMSPSRADLVNSIPYIISGIFAPIVGAVVDYTGGNIVWLFAANTMLFATHSLLAFTFVTPFFSVSVLGLAMSVIASTLWPLVPFVVPSNMIGTAYGAMQSIQNLGLALIPIFIGKIIDSSGYFLAEVTYLFLLCCSFCALSVLQMANTRLGGSLNQSSKQRQRPKLE